jgi:hypothetical protein
MPDCGACAPRACSRRSWPPASCAQIAGTGRGEDRSFQRQLIRENLAQSLMQSWRSWKINPSVQNARFQSMKMSIDETTATIREAHEFRVETYSRVNEKWSAYIRYTPPPDGG